MSIQMLVIMVPVLFGLMGFALDLGRLYLIRGELNQAANAMALAAAQKLIGTSGSLDEATAASQLLLNNSSNTAARYNFGAVVIGESTGLLNSQVSDPAYYDTASSATSDIGGGSSADGATAKFARINLTADAPLLFWSFLSLGQSRSTPIAASALAGISAPLCTACGVEPIAVAAISQDDTTDFGFVSGTRYTLLYNCIGNANGPGQQALANTSGVVQYLLLNRYDDTIALDESQQLYRVGAQGMLPSATAGQSCITVAAEAAENNVVWASVTPSPCQQNTAPAGVRQHACGIYTRFDNAVPDSCATVTDVDTISGQYTPDTDITDLDDYTSYTGNTRRVITVAVVDALSNTAAMVVLGFRQFLLEPNQGLTANDPTDANGRVAALYIGSVMPLKQGRFDGGCQLTSGPGKVVLHQ